MQRSNKVDQYLIARCINSKEKVCVERKWVRPNAEVWPQDLIQLIKAQEHSVFYMSGLN